MLRRKRDWPNGMYEDMYQSMVPNCTKMDRNVKVWLCKWKMQISVVVSEPM